MPSLTSSNHPFPLPPCRASMGAVLVAGSDSRLLPPGLHAWAEPSTWAEPSCNRPAIDAAWRVALAGLVVSGLGQPISGLLNPLRLAAPGGAGLLLLRTGGGSAALTRAAVAAWARTRGLPPLEEEKVAESVLYAAWAGLSLALGRDKGGAVLATWALRTEGARSLPVPAPLPHPTCPSAPFSLTQRVRGGASRRTPALEVEARLGGGSRACLTLHAPFPFRLGPPAVTRCEGGSVLASTARVARRRTLDAPDSVTLCFDDGVEEAPACVRVTAPLARLTPPAGWAVGLVPDRHARVPVPPAALVLWDGESALDANASADPLGFFLSRARPALVTLAFSPLDPAGPRPAVLDESAADLVLALTASLWSVLALALLQACRGARASGEKGKAA